MIHNHSTESREEILGMRGMFEHRALWLYYLLQEAKAKGNLDWEALRGAIRNCGMYQGQGLRAACGESNSCTQFKEAWLPDSCLALFDMEIVQLDQDHLNIDYHYCPLVKAWEKLGCTEEEIARLCEIAMDGDRGIADSMGYSFHLDTAIARGDSVCSVRFTRNSTCAECGKCEEGTAK